MSRPGTTLTFSSDDMAMGEFMLPPDHPGWGHVNRIGDDGPLIAIPRTTLGIRQEGRPAVVADPTRAICYSAGQPYRRTVMSVDGDRCSFISFSHRLAADAAAAYDPVAAADPDTYRFPFVAAQIDRDAYNGHQRARRALAAGVADEGALRESIYWLLARVVSSGYRSTNGTGAASMRRRETATSHGEAVEGVRATIGRRLDAHLTLDDLAANVHMSPFHMSRVFREHTGTSIHAYRTEVRLRASLGRIADGERLADVAAAVGFASHAHLTDKFRRAYGVSPQQWRASQKRRILEAPHREAHVA